MIFVETLLVFFSLLHLFTRNIKIVLNDWTRMMDQMNFLKGPNPLFFSFIYIN